MISMNKIDIEKRSQIYKFKIFPTLCIFIILISTTGCFETISNFSIDSNLRRANPYLNKIDVDSETLHNYAASIIQQCKSDDSACVLNQIYRHIVDNYDYISDPDDEEVIQSPYETINRKGGDCEDLSILLISLLENIGITSYLILTDSHAYALAVNITSESLYPYIEDSLIDQVERDNNEQIHQIFKDTISLNRKSSWYYGGNGDSLSESYEFLTFSYKITSTHPIDIYLVPSIKDFHSFKNHTSFQQFTDYKKVDTTYVKNNCTMISYGGIILHNDAFKSISVNVEIEQYFKPSFYSLFQNNTISSYVINGKQSIVLDPTAGVYGYPGYDANITGEKIAFSPITKDYVYLS